MRSVRDLATISAVWAALVVLLAACGEPLPPKAVPATGTQAAPSTRARPPSAQTSPDSQAPAVSAVTQSDGSICTSIQQTAPPNSAEAVVTASCVCSYDLFSLHDAPVCYPRSALRSWTQPGGGVAGSRLDQIPMSDLSFNPLLPAGLEIHAVSTSDFGVSATDPSLGRIIISEVQDEALIAGGLREQIVVVKGYSGTVADRLTDSDPDNDATVISAATADAILRFPQDGQTAKGHPPIEQLEWIAQGVRVSVVIQLGPTAVLQNPTFDETIARFIDEFQPISQSAFATLVDESGFPFGQNPLDEAKEYASFDALLDEVRLLAQANRAGVTVYDPRSAPGSWQLFFNGHQLAAVIPDLTILEGAGTLTAAGADALVNQAAGDPPGSPSVQRVDLDDNTPCIVTSGDGSLDLTCGGSANIIVDFVAPPIAENGAFDAALTRLKDVAQAVMKTGELIQ